jgi:hypothetical protein
MTSDPERVDSATFAPERLRNDRSRSLALAGWLAVVGAMIGLGVVGRGTGGAIPAQARSSALAVVDTTGATDAIGPLIERIRLTRILLTSQPMASTSGGTLTLTVQGLAFRVDHVVVDVEAADHTVVAEATVNTADQDGGIRPVQTPVFETSFERAAPRSAGTVFVVVTAYGDPGVPVGFVRQAVAIGGLNEPMLQDVPRTYQR